jgi:streptogramin lyase
VVPFLCFVYRRLNLFAREQGLPNATGVIEGACPHLVKDRMDRGGARWTLDGAEAVLRFARTPCER